MLNKNLVYIADTAPLEDGELFERLYNSVSPERRAKIDRLRNEREKRLSLGAYVLLKKALSDIGIDNFSLEYGKNGKPYLAGNSGFYFSLSHCQERVMCVLSPLEVGCDVEAVGDKGLGVAERFFAPEEAAYIRGLEGEVLKKDAFFRLWTLKESFVKCLGAGLSLPLDSFCLDISGKEPALYYMGFTEKPLYFKEYELSDSYKYAVCSQCPRFAEIETVTLD